MPKIASKFENPKPTSKMLKKKKLHCCKKMEHRVLAKVILGVIKTL